MTFGSRVITGWAGGKENRKDNEKIFKFFGKTVRPILCLSSGAECSKSDKDHASPTYLTRLNADLDPLRSYHAWHPSGLD